jgi:hypothetical protein
VWYAGAWRTPEEAEHRRENQRAARRAASTGAPDRRCTSPEEKEATRVARNARRAERLRIRRQNDPEWAERDRVRQRGRPSRYVPTGRPRGRPPATPEERAERERRAIAKRLAASEQRRAVRREKQAIRAAERAAATTAPNAVRTVWRAASAGSIIRRKYPTMEALNASARRGEWDGFEVGR